MPKEAPVCISVINMKGGVGKTTIAALLGRHASVRMGLDVLAIDLDPQANLSQAIMGGHRYRSFLEDQSPSVVEIFQGYQPPVGRVGAPTPLDDIEEVAVCDTAFGGRNLRLIPSRFDFSDNLVNAIRPDPRVLAGYIGRSCTEQTLILIDCAPTESVLTQAAYHASRYILVPVKPEYFATIGFPLLNDSLAKFRSENRGHQIEVIGVVVNNTSYHYSGNQGGPERERAMREIQEEAEENDWHIFRNQLPHSRGFPKMMRGDFAYLGDATLFQYFAEEFFEVLDLQG